MRRRMAGGLAVVVVAVGLMAGSAHGHAPPPEHNHFLTVPGTGDVVAVGPRVCGTPQLHGAFHRFHSNVHVGAPTSTGAISISASLC